MQIGLTAKILDNVDEAFDWRRSSGLLELDDGQDVDAMPRAASLTHDEDRHYGGARAQAD